MKKLFVTFIFLFFVLTSFGQGDWRPIGLNIAGQNNVNGLEASYLVSKCGDNEALTLKLINHTSEPLVVEWYPAVFSYDLKWIRKENQDDKIMITLAPNSEVLGNCTEKQKGLLVYLKDFPIKSQDLKRFGMNNLNFYKK